jgi:hypothetical protein
MTALRRIAVGTVVALVATTLATAARAAPAQVPMPTWVANGTVWALAQDGDTIYLGGSFTELAPPTGAALWLDPTTSAASRAHPPVIGQVRSIVATSTGAWYLGGTFTAVGGSARRGLAAVGPGGAVRPWKPKVTGGAIRSMALSPDGSTLYVGGSFSKVKGAARAGLAAFDTATNALLPWAPPVEGGAVQSIAVAPDGTTVFVGGGFGRVHGATRARLAAVDAATGALRPWNPRANGTVFALDAGTGAIAAGGAFTTLGDVARSRLGAVDPVTGSPLGGWVADADATVRTLARADDMLYVGGDFTVLGSQARSRLGAVDVATGALAPWSPAADGPVQALAVRGDTLIAGGEFTSVGDVPVRRLASIDASTGAVRADWAPNPNRSVLTVTATAASVAAGGAFTGAGGVLRARLAAIDAATGAPTGWNPGADRTVFALAVAPGGATVFAGGAFAHAGGLARSRLVAIDAASGAGIGGFRAGANGRVRALAIADDLLYVGGAFTKLAGQPRARLAAVRTGAQSLDAAWDPGANGQVRTLLISADGATVYAGGEFSTIGGIARTHLAALDAVNGAVRTSFTPARAGFPTYKTFQVATDGPRVFAAMGGPGGGRFRAYDAGSGAPVWEAPTDGDAQAAAFGGSLALAGGHFDAAMGQRRRSLAAFDGATGSMDPWSPRTNGSVWFLGTGPDSILVGGDFARVGATAVHDGFAVFPVP